MLPAYSETAPERSDLESSKGHLLLEFGSNGCGICRAATPLIDAAVAKLPELPHVRVQDGQGKRLGRSFSVKLWPTLILLNDGVEVARLVRPAHADQMDVLLAHARP